MKDEIMLVTGLLSKSLQKHLLESDDLPEWGIIKWEDEAINAFRNIVEKSAEKTINDYISILMSALQKAYKNLNESKTDKEKEKYYGYIIGFSACMAVLHKPVGGIIKANHENRANKISGGQAVRGAGEEPSV